MSSYENALQCVLIMPAYNEEDCISQVLDAWSKKFKSLFGDSYRMVVVNDGSRDGTGAILDRLAQADSNLIVVHKKNGGHGAALRTGYEEALTLNSEYVFQTDSDDQFLPVDFDKLWALRASSNFLLGNRYSRQDPLHRMVITRILRALLLLIFQVSISDSNIPYRLIRSSYLRALLRVLPPGVFAPNIFLAVMAAKDGEKLVGVPVTHVERKTGTVSIVRWNLIKICFRCVRELFDFRLSLRQKLAQVRIPQVAQS